MKEKAENFDVIIIGGGAAGMSAALWCDDLKLSALLLEENSQFGGQLLRVYNEIANYLGVDAADGRELCGKFVTQIKDRDFSFRLNCAISQINFSEKRIILKNGETFQAEFLILATGVRRTKLNIEGTEKFAGKGILESGKKESAIVKDKRVIVVGGGDAALENSLILAETAAKVFLVHRREEFRGRAEFLSEAQNNPKIEILTNAVVTRLSGAKNIESASVKNLKSERITEIETQFLLARIGVQPNSEIAEGALKLDRKGYIAVNHLSETSMKNIFAVGDVANPMSPTISTAAGTGATAVKTIRNKCRR